MSSIEFYEKLQKKHLTHMQSCLNYGQRTIMNYENGYSHKPYPGHVAARLLFGQLKNKITKTELKSVNDMISAKKR